jgi:hypothetical protein
MTDIQHLINQIDTLHYSVGAVILVQIVIICLFAVGFIMLRLALRRLEKNVEGFQKEFINMKISVAVMEARMMDRGRGHVIDVPMRKKPGPKPKLENK